MGTSNIEADAPTKNNRGKPPLLKRIISWFMPVDVDVESAEGFKVQTIILISLLVGNSGFPFMVLFFCMGQPQEAFVVLWSWVIFMCIPFLAKTNVNSNKLAHMLAANYFQCHLFLCLIWGGVDAPNTMWFTAIPIVSVLVGGIRHGLIWGAVAGLSVLSIYGIEQLGLIELNSSLAPEQQVFVLAMGSVGLLAAIFGSTATFEILRLASVKRSIRAEQALLKLNEDLKTLDAEKTSFFQNVSHELRTPLTLILPPLDDAVRTRPDDIQMKTASRNARRLLRLVNQLLDLQKLSSGKRRLEMKPINILSFVNICSDSINSACVSKEISLEVHLEGRLYSGNLEEDVWVSGEIDALEKIVFNFLSNALKFTPTGGSITVDVTSFDDLVRVSVQDNGRGIAKDDLQKLFKEFSQVDASETREFEGTGLGLALAKSLAEKLGGSVGVRSELGEGSVFWLELPKADSPVESEGSEFVPRDWLLDPVTQSVDISLLESQLEEAGDGALALVVDDLPDLRNLVASTLSSQGYRTMQAANGEDALELAKIKRPDIIITDWMMPIMTGVELIEKVRENPDISGVPIVLLTAKSDEQSRLAGTEQGADAFLGKPFSEQELNSIVRNLVALKAREHEVEALNQKLTETVLKRYLPPSLVDRIIDDDLELGAPEMRSVTVLFSDICNFTGASEDLGPSKVSKLLNEYMSTMTEVVFKYEGTIDKFIGDGMMVMFGAPVKLEPAEQARRATQCALAMQEAMTGFASRCEKNGLPILQIRVGIHQGEAVVGNFGSKQRFDYTCIGPMVNIASRIESSSPPGAIMVSSEISGHLDDDSVAEAGLFKLKGIQEERELFLLKR